MATIDLTMDTLKFPALPNYTPTFGKKLSQGSLTSEEICVNSAFIFANQRGSSITETSTTTTIEHDSRLSFSSDLEDTLYVTLGNGSFVGVTVRAYNASSIKQCVNSIDINSGTLAEFIWNGSEWKYRFITYN